MSRGNPGSSSEPAYSRASSLTCPTTRLTIHLPGGRAMDRRRQDARRERRRRSPTGLVRGLVRSVFLMSAIRKGLGNAGERAGRRCVGVGAPSGGEWFYHFYHFLPGLPLNIAEKCSGMQWFAIVLGFAIMPCNITSSEPCGSLPLHDYGTEGYRFEPCGVYFFSRVFARLAATSPRLD